MSKISIIAAVDRRMGIGYQNKLLFWLPNDLKRFKALTTGNTIIMGRKTFESLPKGALPNRRNIVLSTNPATNFPGAEVFPSLEAALQSCHEKEHVYIIGGETLFLIRIHNNRHLPFYSLMERDKCFGTCQSQRL